MCSCIMLYKQVLHTQAMPMEIREKKDGEDRKNGFNAACLGTQDELVLPIYFGTACGLAAINVLETSKRNKHMKLMLPITGSFSDVQVMLKGASQLLGLLVWKAQGVVAGNNGQERELEKKAMAEKVAKAEAVVAEMKKQRAEDAKANEKVVAMFATQEQNWKMERRNLKQQLEAVLKDFQSLQTHAQMAVPDDKHNSSCSDCGLKEQRITELNAKIGEKDFLMMTTMEAVEAERKQTSELQQKLSASEALNQELKDKLSKEMEERESEFRRHKAAFVDFVANQRQMKLEMNQALRQLESVRKEADIISNEKNEAEAIIQSLSVQISLLEKESQDKEDVISDLLKKYHAEANEKDEIERELKISKALRRHAELEAERWRREYEGKIQNTRKQRWKLRNYSVGRADSRSDAYTELRRLQAEELKNLHMKYGTQISFLQDKIKRYEEKLTELEHNILLHMNHKRHKPTYDDRAVGNTSSHVRDLIEFRDPVETDSDIKQFQYPDLGRLACKMDTDTTGISKLQNSNEMRESKQSGAYIMRQKNKDTEMAENSKDWIRPEKVKHRAKLDEKHWQGLNAASSQMSFEDDNVEHFHWYMLNMAKDSRRLQSTVATLNRELKQAKEENKLLEYMLIERNHELKSLKERLNLIENKRLTQKNYTDLQISNEKRDAEVISSELKAVKKKLRERERTHRAMLLKILEETENELQEKDYKLAVAEAKFLQTQIQCQQERKANKDVASKILERKPQLQEYLFDHLCDEFEHCRESVFCASCLEEYDLSDMVSKAKDSMFRMESSHDKELKDLITKAARVSRAGCHIRTMKHFIKNAEEAIQNSTHCRHCNMDLDKTLKSKDEDKEDLAKFNNRNDDFTEINSSLKSRQTSLGVGNSENCRSVPKRGMNINVKLHTELKGTSSCQCDATLNACRMYSNGSVTKKRELPKGKTMHNCQCLSKIEGEDLRDGKQELEGHKQIFKETVASTKSVPIPTPSHENTSISLNNSDSSGSTLERNESSWSQNVQALSASLNIKEVWQQLEQLEKTSKSRELDFIATDSRNVQICGRGGYSHSTRQSISAVELLKKQVKRYQSLTEKIIDLCKQMHDKESISRMGSLQDEAEDQTSARQLYLEEAYQLQNYIFATGQKLNLIQPEVSGVFADITKECTPQALDNTSKSIEIAIAHLNEIQKKLEAWAVKIIGDLEEQLPKNGIMHVLPSQEMKKTKSKIRKTKIFYRPQRLDARKLSV